MKSDRIQKYKSKDRQKGLPKLGYAESQDAQGWGFQSVWPVAGVLRAARTPDFSSLAEPVLGTHEEILDYLTSVLSASPVGRMLLKEAAAEKWSLGIADLDGHDFHLDVPERHIILDDAGLLANALGRSSYFLNAMKISLVRALRDVWQEKRHGGFDKDYGPEQILMLERVRAADCDVLAALVAWELRGEGHNDLWRHLVGSGEGDVAMAFSNRLERDPSSQFTGQALVAAFEQWFRDIHRVNACDHETLEYIDDVIRGHRGQRGHAFGQKKLTRTGIEILSCLPDKTAYLRGRGHDILQNPLYSGLHDEINQSHFVQIVSDMQATYVQGIPFRDASLADRIFPGGDFTRETRTSDQDFR